MRLLVILGLFLGLCSPCFGWNGTAMDSDGNIDWINIGPSGSGTITDSDGNVTWIQGN